MIFYSFLCRLLAQNVLISHVCTKAQPARPPLYSIGVGLYFLIKLLGSDNVAQVIYNHVHKCRENPFMQHAKIIIIPESNIATVAQELDRQIQGPYWFENKKVMYEDNANKGGGGGIQHDMPGSVTTNRSKIDMVIWITERYMKPNKIVFSKELISTHEGMISSIGQIQKEFVRELRLFSKIKEDLPSGGCKVTYSGKRAGCDDDLVLTLLIAVFFHNVFMTDNRYAMDRTSRNG